MKRFAIIMALLAVNLSFTFGQALTDSISMKKVFGGYSFYKAEKRLSMNQLVNEMKSNPQAFTQIKTARTTYSFASILGFAGGFMVGWPIGTAIAGGDPNWTMAAVGAGLVVVSIPIIQKYNKQARQAVDTYNGGLKPTSMILKNELRLSMTKTGAGLILRF